MSTENSTVKVFKNDHSEESGIDRARSDMARRIKSAREARLLTVIAFGQVGGVTKQTQLAYERGARAPDADYLRRLHEALGMDIAYLVTGRTLEGMAALSQQEAESIGRYRALPPKIRKTVDDVLLLAWLAYQDRKGYEASV